MVAPFREDTLVAETMSAEGASPPTRVNYEALKPSNCPVCSGNRYQTVTRRFDSGRLVECLHCGHIFLNPTLPADALQAIYHGYHASAADEDMLEMIRGWVADGSGAYQWALRKVGERGGFRKKRVLEIGCGPGVFLNECRSRGADVLGVDPSPRAARLASRQGLHMIDSTFEHALEQGWLGPRAFDLVFAFEVIEHVPRPGAFLDALHDLLVLGGALYLSTPNFQLFYLMGAAAPAVTNWQEHLHFFTPKSLRSRLEERGFKEICVETLSPLTVADRQKQVLLHRAWIRSAWGVLRHWTAVRRLKDTFFARLGAHREVTDGCIQGAGLVATATVQGGA